MTKPTDKPEKPGRNAAWTGAAAVAGAAVGSAAVAAALLYVTRRKDKAEKTRPTVTPPETD